MQALVQLRLDLLRLSWTKVQPSLLDFFRLVQIRDFLANVALVEELDVLQEKRQRGSVDARRVVPDILEDPYLHNSLLDIDELIK